MSQYDLVGIGNALVDVLARIDDGFLADHELPKGAMILVEADQSKRLYDQLGTAVEVSGGSCGNTLSGFASMGGRGAYIGKVRNDQFGDVFRHDLRAMNVDFHTPSATDGPPTKTSRPDFLDFIEGRARDIGLRSSVALGEPIRFQDPPAVADPASWVVGHGLGERERTSTGGGRA